MRTYSLSIRCCIGYHTHHLSKFINLDYETFLAFDHIRNLSYRGEDFGAWMRGVVRKKPNVFFCSLTRCHRAIDRFRKRFSHAAQPDLKDTVSADRTGNVEMLIFYISTLLEKLHHVVCVGFEGGNAMVLAQKRETADDRLRR